MPYSDSRQHFELLKEDLMQNANCPFKKQPVNVVLWKRRDTWQRNSETVKSRQMWNWRILTWHFECIARHLWGDWISSTTRLHVPLWGDKAIRTQQGNLLSLTWTVLYFFSLFSRSDKSCQIILVCAICVLKSRVVSFPPFKTICPCSPVSLVPQTVTPGSAAYYMGGVVLCPKCTPCYNLQL